MQFFLVATRHVHCTCWQKFLKYFSGSFSTATLSSTNFELEEGDFAERTESRKTGRCRGDRVGISLVIATLCNVTQTSFMRTILTRTQMINVHNTFAKTFDGLELRQQRMISAFSRHKQTLLYLSKQVFLDSSSSSPFEVFLLGHFRCHWTTYIEQRDLLSLCVSVHHETYVPTR